MRVLAGSAPPLKGVTNLRLTSKLTLVFIVFAMVVLVGVNVLVHAKGQEILISTAITGLEAIGKEKESALENWVLRRQATVEMLADSPDLRRDLAVYIRFGSAAKAAHNRLFQELARYTGPGNVFHNLFILSADNGNILISADPREDREPFLDSSNLSSGEATPLITPIYYSNEWQTPTMTILYPLLSTEGEQIGILAGQLNLDEWQEIVQQHSEEHETYDAFLVHASGLALTQPRFLPEPSVFQRSINSAHVRDCLEGTSDTILTEDYQNIPVIASSRWLPEYQVCLIVKVTQAEALAPLAQFRNNMAWIVLAAFVVASIAAVPLSHTIVRPILSMQSTVQRFGRGELDIRLAETRRDELGMLAHEFNQMADSLVEQERQLQLATQILEQTVEERTRALQQTVRQLQRAEEIGQVGSWEWYVSENRAVTSPGLQKLLGLTGEDAGNTLEAYLERVHPDDREKVRQVLTSALQAVGPFDLETRIIRTDGKVLFIYTRGETIVDQDGNLEGLTGISLDITERKQIEESVASMQRRFQALIENAPDGIALLGLDGKLRQVTPSTFQILGYTLEEAQGQDPAQLTHPDDLPGLLQLLNEVIQEPGKVVRTEYRFKHKDGSWHWLGSTISNLIAEPSVEAIVFNYQDITERKRANEALQEKERLLSEAQRMGRIGSWSYDIASDTIKFSEGTYSLFDIEPQDFPHHRQALLNLIYPSDQPAVAAWMDDLTFGVQSRELHFRIFHRNGELRYLQSSGAVNFDQEGKPTAFIGMIQDVSERRMAEIQIEQQIKRLTALSEIDRAIISSSDQKYTIGVILSHLISQLQVDAADVLLLDPDRNVLTYANGQGFHTTMAQATRVRVGESHAGRAAKERHMIRISDLREAANLVDRAAFVEAEGFVSYIAVPLIVKGHLKGVLEVYQRSLLQPYQEWLDFFHTLTGQLAIAIENTSLFENLRATNQELLQAYDATIEGWSRAMDLRDQEPEGHTRRVTELTLELAQAVRVDESRLGHIRRGALLHDIGKLGIPDHILLKPGKLTAQEWAIMQKHTELAYDLLAPIEYLKPALNIPYFHHEKWDGSGYPLALKGEQIPLEARIFALADVWDALTSDRPYRSAWTKEQALAYIRDQSGIHFDPHLVEVFLKIITKDL